MSNVLRRAVEKKKQFYIERLLAAGVYKQADHHLYEMTLSELEQVYESYENIKRKPGTLLH